MNYFPFHIGDYAAHTGHLEPMEDLIYRRLLDAYYLREGPLPAEVQSTAKLIRLRSMASDVESVLKEFFELTEAGWMHRRCEAEVTKMQDKQAKARDAAQQSVNSRKAAAERRLAEQQANAERTLPSGLTDVQLPTPTPTPTPKNKDMGAEAPPNRKRRLPEDFAPNETGVKAAETAGLDLGREVQAFRDHHQAQGSSMLDWQAAWRTWVNKAVQFGRGGKKPAATSTSTTWSKAAGFETVYEAQNEGCYSHTAHLFRDGKRIQSEVAT